MTTSFMAAMIKWGSGTFAIDLLPLIAVAAAACLCLIMRKYGVDFEKPHIRFSSTDIPNPQTAASKWSALPRRLLWLALASFAVALSDPRFYLDKQITRGPEAKTPPNNVNPVEGIAIYLVLDQSGSMRESVPAGRRRSVVKIDLLKQVTRQFIIGDESQGLYGRPNDMIGLVSFARGANVLSPLTLDHEAVLDELSLLKPVEQRDQDGTSIGYAIFKTANLIAATRHYAEELVSKGEPAYTIKNSVMILITDGLQDPNPLDKGKRLRNIDVPEAAAYAKEQGIKLYIINVEPKLATDEFSPYRHLMQRAAEETGGKFYMVDETGNLAGIYKQIDTLEKTILPETAFAKENLDQRPDRYSRFPLFPYLILFGLVALAASTLLDGLVLRRFP